MLPEITPEIAINFFERLLKHTGEYYGDPFLLTPWEEEALREIFGRRDDAGNLLIELAYLELPKKTGKTEFAAGLTLLLLCLTSGHGIEVYGAASAQRQALNVYRAVDSMISQSPHLQKIVRVLRSTHRVVRRDDPNSFYAAIAADGDLTDGVNPKFVIADEVHRWKTRKQLENWDVLTLGGIARKSRVLTIGITTAGRKSESPIAWRMHEKTVAIEKGVIEDPAFYGRIYAADPQDDWTAENTWIKANPSLKQNGGFLDIQKIRDKFRAAQTEPDGIPAFKRYMLNLWDEYAERAIDMLLWHACEAPFQARGWPAAREHDFIARFVDRRCWVGIDLSLTTDMSGAVAVFDFDDAIEILPFFWMPKANLRTREIRDGMPYSRWAEQGYIELCEGTAIDYGTIRERLRWCAQMFDVQEFCFDRYNSREMSVALVEEGYPCIEVPQTFTGMSEATKKFIRLVGERKVHHGNHPVLAWNASCLSLKSDGNDLVRPVKPERDKDRARIDGVTAALNALARLVVANQSTDVSVVVV